MLSYICVLDKLAANLFPQIWGARLAATKTISTQAIKALVFLKRLLKPLAPCAEKCFDDRQRLNAHP
jgi:hypothetical protein